MYLTYNINSFNLYWITISYFDVQLTMKEIPINFGETMAGNSNRQIADPAGMDNSEIDDVSASPEVMTSLQMFQQQR